MLLESNSIGKKVFLSIIYLTSTFSTNVVMPSFAVINENSDEKKTLYLKNFSNRFFTVKTDNKKNVVTVNTDDVFFTSASEAVEYAKTVLAKGKKDISFQYLWVPSPNVSWC